MRNDFESNYLMHHGILGMKWGVKNGPPYPLGASDHSASEKKAGWKKSLSGDTTKAPISNEELERRKQVAKKIAIGVAITGVVAGSVYIAYRTGALNSTVEGVKSLYSKTGVKLTDKQLKQVTYDACKSVTSDISTTLSNMPTKLEQNGSDYVLKAGSKINHISGKADFDINKSVSDRLYVSFTDDDVAAYKSLLNIRGNGGAQNERYNVSLKAIKDLVVPSEERTNQIVNELLNKQEFKNKLVNSMTNYKMESLGFKNVHSKSPYYKGLYKMHRQRQLDEFNGFSDNKKIQEALWSVVRDDATSKDIKNAFKQQGFDAIFDINDKGVIAEKPLIVLDAKSNLSVIGKEAVNNTNIQKAAEQLLNNPNHPAYKDAKDLLNKIVIAGGDLSKATK